MNKAFFFIASLLIVQSVAWGNTSQGYQLTMLQSGPEKLRLKIELPEPRLVEENNRVYASYEKASFAVDNNRALLPCITKLFNLADTSALQPELFNTVKKSITIKDYLLLDEQTPAAAAKNDGQFATVDYLGMYRDSPVFALRIYPVSYDPQSQSLEWIEKAEIEIRLAGSSTGSQSRVSSAAQNTFIGNDLINSAGKVYGVQQPQANLKTSRQSTSLSQANSILNNQHIFKISIDREGLYKIDYNDLEDADYPISLVNPNRLKLYNKGREIPVYFKGAADGVFDENDYFEFWAEKNEKTFLDQFPDLYADPFTDENIYWLVEAVSNGQRMHEESGGLVNSAKGYVFEPYAFREKLHFEENRYRENFGHYSSSVNRPSYEMDHWFFDSGISAPEGVAYDFYLPHPFESGSDVVVTAAFRGKSYYSYPSNLLTGHKLELKLRGKEGKAKLISEVNPSDGWKNQSMRIISNADSAVKLSQSALNNGINRLEVDLFQTGVTDIVLLNWFDVSYLRKYRAYQNYLKFKVDEDFFSNRYINLGDTIQINIDGFNSPDIEVYKIGVSKILNGKIDTFVDEESSSIGISIQDEVFDTDQEYIALTESAKQKPLSIRPFMPWDNQNGGRRLAEGSNSAEYLIITNELFRDNCEKLKELKEADGLHTEIVTVENIYDEFNYGIKSPLAIKDFLHYALENWSQANRLKYVVFVGEASNNYKGQNGYEMVPTFLFQTVKFGSAASDYWYALLSGDDYIPDVTVARIPVATNQELVNYIDKVENYPSNAPVDQWRNSALFLSGNDAGGGDRENLTNQPIFRAQNLRLINMQLPEGMFAHRLNTVKDETIEGYDPNFGSTTDLIEYFDDGVSFVNFLGHGGGAIWADVQLLNLDDVDRLNNEYKLPFVASMTCFTGAFENQGRQCLGQKLLVAEKKGAIAYLGASGVGWKYNDFAIEWSLAEFLWDGSYTFGEAVDLMKMYYLANPIYVTENGEFFTWSYYSLYRSMVSQYNLLGDPALRMQKPAKRLTVNVDNNSPAAGDTITVSVSGNLGSASGQLEVVNTQNQRIYQNNFSYSGGLVQLDIPLPFDASEEEYKVKAYLANASEDASGADHFAIQEPIVTYVKTNPQEVQVNQEIEFEIGLQSYAQVDQMHLKNFRNFGSLSSNGYTLPMQKISDTLFQSVEKLPPFTSGGRKYFDIVLKTGDDAEKVFRWQKLEITDTRPDLKIDPESIRLAGSNRLQLEFKVSNESQIPLDEIKISCFDDFGMSSGTAFAETFVSFSANEEKTITVNYDSTAFTNARTFRIVVDSEEKIDERTEANNTVQKMLTVNFFFVDKQIGTSIDGLTNENLVIGDNWDFFVAPNTISESIVIKFSEENIHAFIESKKQAGLSYVATGESLDSTALRLAFSDNNSNRSLNGRLSVRIDSTRYQSTDLEHISFFEFDETLGIWIRLQQVWYSGFRISAEISKTGLYAIFKANDNKEPFVEITVNGRPLIDEMLIVRRPSLAFLVQDENGINFNQSFSIELDQEVLLRNGQIINEDEISLSDSLVNAKAISVLARPELSPGLHNLSIEVSDVNGNQTTRELSFVVSDDFDIRVYGNYPNPFSDQTIISYFVDSFNDIDEFSIKIYTTSGRLIRSRMLELDESLPDHNIKSPFYHELIWDGTDDDGYDVANGVYFAVISGKYQGKSVKHTIKIARIR